MRCRRVAAYPYSVILSSAAPTAFGPAFPSKSRTLNWRRSPRLIFPMRWSSSSRVVREPRIGKIAASKFIIVSCRERLASRAAIASCTRLGRPTRGPEWLCSSMVRSCGRLRHLKVEMIEGPGFLCRMLPTRDSRLEGLVLATRDEGQGGMPLREIVRKSDLYRLGRIPCGQVRHSPFFALRIPRRRDDAFPTTSARTWPMISV